MFDGILNFFTGLSDFFESVYSLFVIFPTPVQGLVISLIGFLLVVAIIRIIPLL